MKNNYFCKLSRDIGESYEQFIERGYFVVSQKPLSVKDLEKVIIYSRIRNNMRLHKCEYDKEIHDIIREMESRC